jgi:hypothetical protein
MTGDHPGKSLGKAIGELQQVAEGLSPSLSGEKLGPRAEGRQRLQHAQQPTRPGTPVLVTGRTELSALAFAGLRANLAIGCAVIRRADLGGGAKRFLGLVALAAHGEDHGKQEARRLGPWLEFDGAAGRQFCRGRHVEVCERFRQPVVRSEQPGRVSARGRLIDNVLGLLAFRLPHEHADEAVYSHRASALVRAPEGDLGLRRLAALGEQRSKTQRAPGQPAFVRAPVSILRLRQFASLLEQETKVKGAVRASALVRAPEGSLGLRRLAPLYEQESTLKSTGCASAHLRAPVSSLGLRQLAPLLEQETEVQGAVRASALVRAPAGSLSAGSVAALLKQQSKIQRALGQAAVVGQAKGGLCAGSKPAGVQQPAQPQRRIICLARPGALHQSPGCLKVAAFRQSGGLVDDHLLWLITGVRILATASGLI